MQTTIQAQSTTASKKHWWQNNKAAGAQSVQPVGAAVHLPVGDKHNFYERAIEWTHGADKIINLVLGYILAIASVLGFMDVLSNGQVLSQVPFMFYIWLGIMGLGVDFQILLVIGRIPDLFHMPVAGWQKWLIFFFNVGFLAFLALMSIVISAVFTQHHDMPTQATINDAMNALSIDSILFVYGRAALATLLLVLMAVDRTMERWRMQISATQAYSAQAITNAAQIITPVQPVITPTPPAQASDIDKVLQAVIAMNQQNILAMQEMNKQMLGQVSQVTVSLVEETVNRLTANISLPVITPMPQIEEGVIPVSPQVQATDELEVVAPLGTSKMGEQNSQIGKSYEAEIKELLQNEPHLKDSEIAEKIGCSVKTAYKWRTSVQVPA